MKFISSSSIEEDFEDTKGVIRTRKSTKVRHHNDQQSDLMYDNVACHAPMRFISQSSIYLFNLI